MNTKLAIPVLPAPPPTPTLGGSAPFLAWVTGVQQHLANLRRTLDETLGQVIGQVNSGVQGVGVVLDSADAMLTPTAPIHHVTGVGVITTIAPPGSMQSTTDVSAFSGPVWLIADGAWLLATGGNIAAAVTAVVGKAVMVVYDPNSKLWYPSI